LSLPLPVAAGAIVGLIAGHALKAEKSYRRGRMDEREKIDRWIKSRER
jgi:hypothetical protein